MDRRDVTSSMSAAAAAAAVAVALLSAGVAGCAAVGPNYKRPDVAPAQEFRSHVGPAEASSLADLPWWQVFNDKSLQALIGEGLANNYDLRIAMFEMVFRKDIPPVVSINEAIDLSKQFSNADAKRFINGILDRLKDQLGRDARKAE